eukprot:Amastigsp_a345778_30.p3 type:complete len:150 gc:universal Amastigsp_a345778_30:532-981(+)
MPSRGGRSTRRPGFRRRCPRGRHRVRLGARRRVLSAAQVARGGHRQRPEADRPCARVRRAARRRDRGRAFGARRGGPGKFPARSPRRSPPGARDDLPVSTSAAFRRGPRLAAPRGVLRAPQLHRRVQGIRPPAAREASRVGRRTGAPLC